MIVLSIMGATAQFLQQAALSPSTFPNRKLNIMTSSPLDISAPPTTQPLPTVRLSASSGCDAKVATSRTIARRSVAVGRTPYWCTISGWYNVVLE